MTASRHRLDAVLVDRGVAATLDRARALISAGLVEVDGHRAGSAAQPVEQAVAIRLTDRSHPWAGRGGLKLDGALTAFGVDANGRICLDAGASTGGFTDVLLSRGAARVYAVDVGYGQLDPRLSGDDRVVVMDRTNLRTLERLEGAPPTLVTLDLSFISLRAVFPALLRLAPAAEVVALFKPQFEVARGAVGPGGVVADPSVSAIAVSAFLEWATGQGVVSPSAPVASVVRGAKGNQEWLVHLRLPAVPS